ncbi:hypothetical protein ACWEKT_27265 [Nocardia takedensis]|uniref:hypothetical protein n=1 Tax=Nocardia takedensis TaxID=259390 RepID=UPI00059543E4|nr:hypothetical protein [Nocardia takedensis]
MSITPARLVIALASAFATAVLVGARPATADSGVLPAIDHGRGCVVDPADSAVTLDSLRHRCSLDQQNAIFAAAGPGASPTGATDGWVVSPAAIHSIAPALWRGKTFYTGPDGGHLMNRVTGAGIEGFPAQVYVDSAITDGAPTWVLNYELSPIPQIYDEIREITPGVWFGYSWWRETSPPTLLLTFALA